MVRRAARIFLATLFSFSLALAGHYPLTVRDALGRVVTIPARPQRVISLLPSDSETICAIGACGLLVGVDRYSTYPPALKSLPHLGGLYNPKIAQIVALHPDLVVASPYGKLVSALSRLGLTVITVDPNTYAGIFRATELLGRVLDKTAQAKALITRIREEVAAIERVAARAKTRPTVYYEIDPTPYTVGPKSFIGTLITRAGGINIITASMGFYPKISPALVIADNPQVMIGLSLQQAEARPGWSQIRAVRSGRVYPLSNHLQNILSRPGPRVPQALLALARFLHPRLFRNFQLLP